MIGADDVPGCRHSPDVAVRDGLVYVKGQRLYPDWYEYRCCKEFPKGSAYHDCKAYHEKNWGKDFTSPWVWISSCNLTSELTGKKLENSVFDIGGGSFQIVTEDRALSFPCGCVRAKERCDASDPDTLARELYSWMDERSDVPNFVQNPVYGVGGTITTLGALLGLQQTFDPHKLETITIPKLEAILKSLSAIPERQRMQLPLLSRRGDVILQGATILKYMMQKTGTEAVIPSDRDGTEGIAEAFIKENL